MTLSVVNLSRIDLATDDDKEHHIDKWAALFKAKTWEELKMIAANNEYLTEASETIYQMSADERIRKICRDREEYYQDIRSYQRTIAKKDSVIAERDNTIAKQKNRLTKQKDELIKKDTALAEKEALIKQLFAEISSLKK